MFPPTFSFPGPPAKFPTVRDFVRIPRSRVAHDSLPRFIPRRKVHRSHIVCSRRLSPFLAHPRSSLLCGISFGFHGAESRMIPCLDSFLGERCTDRISYVPADFLLSWPTREVPYCAGFRSHSTEQSRACFLAGLETNSPSFRSAR